MYDTNSTMARKNPVGALDAYKKAFPVEDEHVGLVIKMNNPKQEDLEVLREQTKGYQNVYLIAEVLDKPKVNSLIAAVDVFVSLHRAEGFGLVMAEAMLLDTVCVATGLVVEHRIHGCGQRLHGIVPESGDTGDVRQLQKGLPVGGARCGGGSRLSAAAV